MARVLQGAFNAGIISSGMYARADTEKYQKGLREALNMVVRPQGGAANRAGFEAATSIDVGTNVHLVPFEFSTSQTYVLEINDATFRVVKAGRYVFDSAAGTLPISGVTTDGAAEFTLVTPTPMGTTFNEGAVVQFMDPNGTHALHEAMCTLRFSADGVRRFFGPDGVSVDTTSGAWGTVGAGAYLRKVYECEHTLTNLTSLRYAQDADTLYLAHPEHPPAKIIRMAEDAWTFENVQFGAKAQQLDTTLVAITAATQANPAVITAAAHGLAVGDAFLIDGVVGMTQLNKELFRVRARTTNTITLETLLGEAVDATAYTAYASGGSLYTPAAKAKRGADVDLADLTTYEYAVSTIDAATGEESLTSNVYTITNDLFYKGSINTVVWGAVASASRYVVYRKSAGALAYIGTTKETFFEDENITPDTARGPMLARNPFSGAGDYPSAVAFFEQRLAYGATLNDPQLVEMSRVDHIENFNGTFPSLPDDAFRFRIRDSRVNEIRSFVPGSSFAILTSGGEWELAGQGDGDYLRPDQRKLAPISNYGSAFLPPIYTGTVALFVEPSRNVVREYRLDGNGQPPQDLTVVARDVFEDRAIVSWAYAASPDKIVWAVLDDGTLATMTYMPEHDVWGWTRHELGGEGFARQVTVIREGARDVPYVVVSRTWDERTVTTVERYSDRNDSDAAKGYYLDGGYVRRFNEETDEIQGLYLLRGRTVSALVGGDVYEELVVDETGTVIVPGRPSRDISVGHPYVSRLETLNLQMDIQGRGSSEGSYKSASEIVVRLKRSRGVSVGTDLARMTEPKEFSTPMIGAPIPLSTRTVRVTNSGDWEMDTAVYVEQRYPLPLTVLSVTPDWEVGE